VAFDGLVPCFFRYDNPQYEVGDQAWQAAWEKQDKERQPEPESADPKEFTQSTAHPCYDPVSS